MNKVLIGWNVILTALVVFLLANPNTSAPVQEETNMEDTATAVLAEPDSTPREMAKVVYINNDTLFKYFEMYDDLKDELSAEKTRMENKLQREMEKLEKDYNNLMERASMGLMSRSEGEAAQNRILEERERLVQMEQDLSSQLGKKETDLIRKIKRTIEEYCDRRRDEFGYDFVLSKSDIDGIHYASADREITMEVVNGLNAEYKAKKEAKNTTKK